MAARLEPIVLEPVVVFDFDGTIVSKNTGSEFYKWMARKSLVRVILLTLLLPILIPLRVFAFFTNNPLAQKIGLNIVCMASTSFLKTPLFSLRRSFIKYYLSRGGAVVHQEAIQRIQQHQARGDKVCIISGCPEWILHGMVKTIGISNVRIVGSAVSFSWKGFLLQNHCHQANKVNMAIARGIDLSHCSHGYSDSITDAGILRHCQSVILINANFLEKWFMGLLIQKEVSVEQWR